MTDITDTTKTPGPARHRRRWSLAVKITAWVVAYVVLGVFAHLLGPAHLTDAILLSYVIAEVGGAAFLIRYVRTDWRAHPWGRHVMAFMVCMEVLFTLTLSRRLFGAWPGLAETGFLASVTFACIVWWRYRLLVGGRSAPGRPDDD